MLNIARDFVAGRWINFIFCMRFFLSTNSPEILTREQTNWRNIQRVREKLIWTNVSISRVENERAPLRIYLETLRPQKCFNFSLHDFSALVHSIISLWCDVRKATIIFIIKWHVRHAKKIGKTFPSRNFANQSKYISQRRKCSNNFCGSLNRSLSCFQSMQPTLPNWSSVKCG